MKSLRFGLAGAGGICERFARVLGRVEGVELAAVANRTLERAQTLADRYGAPAFSSVEEMLERCELDAVYIGLTNQLHLPVAKQCMERGKHVLCEKPMALTEADAREMVSCADRHGALLMEAMWTRCLPSYRKVLEWVRTGRIGRVRLIQSSFDPGHRLYDPALGGGALYDIGVYSVEYATGLLGRPDAVRGDALPAPTGVDELAVVNLLYRDGAVATSTCAVSVTAVADARIFGEGGMILVEPDFYQARRCVLYGADRREREVFECAFEDGFSYEIEHFRDLWRAGKRESDHIPLGDSVDCTAIFDALRADWNAR